MSPGTFNPFPLTPFFIQAMSLGQTHLSGPAQQSAFRGRKSESSYCWPYCFTDYWLQVIRFQQFREINLWKRKAERRNEPIHRTRAQLQLNWQTWDRCNTTWINRSEKSFCNLSCAVSEHSQPEVCGTPACPRGLQGRECWQRPQQRLGRTGAHLQGLQMEQFCVSPCGPTSTVCFGVERTRGSPWRRARVENHLRVCEHILHILIRSHRFSCPTIR